MSHGLKSDLMRRLGLSLLCAAMFVGLSGCDVTYSEKSHFSFPLPSGSKLRHYLMRQSGPDTNYSFVFEGAHRELCDLIVKEWGLSRKRKQESFLSLNPPNWWPTNDEWKAMDEIYAWEDETKQLYRSVWLDTNRGFVYIEYGDY